MKLDQYKAQAAKHVLIYGAPKSGKTAGLAQLAAKFRLHILDNEDSVKTLLNPALVKPEWRDNINVYSIPDKQTYPMAIETTLKVIKGGPCPICHAHGKVSCPLPACKVDGAFSTIDVNKFEVDKDILVIDSYSQLAESAMNYIMKADIAKDNWDAKAGWDEYGKQGRILERIGSTIQIAPYNVVVSSHEMMVEMEDKTKKIVPIGGTSNVSKVFAKYFDEVVYCEVVNRTHRLVSSTTSKPNVLAGSRSGVELQAGQTLLSLFGVTEAVNQPK